MRSQRSEAGSLPGRENLPTLLTVTTGNSGTSLPRKLRISAESRVLVLGRPPQTDLGVWDCATRHTRAGKGRYDVVLAFAADRATLGRRFAPAMAATTTAGRLWVCWPKRSSGVATDLSDDVVRDFGLAHGVVDVLVCAIDDTWSALAFVRRLRDR